MTDIREHIESLNKKDRHLLYHKLVESISAPDSEIKVNNRKKIVAYLKTSRAIDTDTLKTRLKSRLPEYMIPSKLVSLETFPKLPNGKVDINQLKSLVLAEPTSKPKIKRELNDTELKLIRIWSDVLSLNSINIHDNFFEIGGDSISSIRIISKARDQGIPLKANHIFEHQTIGELAQFLQLEEGKKEEWNCLTALRKDGSKKPLFCIHAGGGHVFFYNLLNKYLRPNRPIYALNPIGLYGDESLHRDVEEMTTEYLSAIKTIQPKGPYNILVYCFSTAVGNEMAIQLAKTKEQINIIVMDTMASPWKATTKEQLSIRIGSFFKRLIKSPYQTIRLFIEERYYIINSINAYLFGNEDQKKLEKLRANLRTISKTYKWIAHSGKVSLILTKKPDQRFQDLIIRSWENLAKGGVDLYYSKGFHTTLFEEPDISYVSEKIDECMLD